MHVVSSSLFIIIISFDGKVTKKACKKKTILEDSYASKASYLCHRRNHAEIWPEIAVKKGLNSPQYGLNFTGADFCMLIYHKNMTRLRILFVSLHLD
jgi:hypothetical protein